MADPSRIAAKVALDNALDRIDDFVPDRKESIVLIEQAAKAYHVADEYLRGATYGSEPLPVAMRRASERRASAKTT